MSGTVLDTLYPPPRLFCTDEETKTQELWHRPTFTQLVNSGTQVQMQDCQIPEAWPFTLDLFKPIASV